MRCAVEDDADANAPRQSLVARGHRAQRRPRPRAQRLHMARPEENRSLPETLGDGQRPAQGRRVPVGHVDADLLHQPGGAEPAAGAPAHASARQGRAARGVRPAAERPRRGDEALRGRGTAMRALTVAPGRKGSIQLEDRPDLEPPPGCALVEAVALGLCGTDRDIVAGDYGWAPAGEERLILGHESLGRVVEAPPGSDLRPGDLVVGIVRRPDPVPCPACAVGEWDMCRNGRYTERGIKERHGYGAERWAIEPDFAVKVDPRLGLLGVLLEPTSVVAKAWDHILRIGRRTRAWTPGRVLVTGAGPVGLLAAML